MNILFGTALLCKIPKAGAFPAPRDAGILLFSRPRAEISPAKRSGIAQLFRKCGREGSKLENQAENGGARGVRAVSERYCPVAGRNVAVEITRRGFAETDAKCLSDCACKGSPGGCRNRFLPAAQ